VQQEFNQSLLDFLLCCTHSPSGFPLLQGNAEA